MEKEYFENDKPRDYTQYINMSKKERTEEIERLEAKIKAETEKK